MRDLGDPGVCGSHRGGPAYPPLPGTAPPCPAAAPGPRSAAGGPPGGGGGGGGESPNHETDYVKQPHNNRSNTNPIKQTEEMVLNWSQEPRVLLVIEGPVCKNNEGEIMRVQGLNVGFHMYESL